MSTLRLFLSALALVLSPLAAHAVSPEMLFRDGADAYRSGDFPRAAAALRAAAARAPAPGTLQNLGNAEWLAGNPGYAVLAWERALWIEPLNAAARNNLKYARREAQLETPDLAWYEVVSSWLPASAWAWVASISFWLAAAMVVLPGVMRARRAAWHQALAAVCLMVFLLSVPAQAGVHARSKVGFVLEKDVPLRLTPTAEAQTLTRLAAGEPARYERVHGNYLLLRTNRGLGWIERDKFGLICGNP